MDENMLPAIGRAAMLDSNSGKVNMAMSGIYESCFGKGNWWEKVKAGIFF